MMEMSSAYPSIRHELSIPSNSHSPRMTALRSTSRQSFTSTHSVREGLGPRLISDTSFFPDPFATTSRMSVAAKEFADPSSRISMCAAKARSCISLMPVDSDDIGGKRREATAVTVGQLSRARRAFAAKYKSRRAFRLAWRAGAASVVAGLPVWFPVFGVNVLPEYHLDPEQYGKVWNKTILGQDAHSCKDDGLGYNGLRPLSYKRLDDCMRVCANCEDCAGFVCWIDPKSSPTTCHVEAARTSKRRLRKHFCTFKKRSSKNHWGHAPGQAFYLKSKTKLSAALYYTAYFVIFTYWEDLGSTVRYAIQGVEGTLIACINIVIMNGIFPHGVTNDAVVPWRLQVIGIANTFLLTLLMLWLDIESNTRKFALSFHVWFMMCFLDPRDRSFSEGWHLRSDGLAVIYVLISLAGSLISILAVLIPSPIRALERGQELLCSAGSTFGQGLRSGSYYFLGLQSDEIEAAVLLACWHGHLEDLELQLKQLEEAASAAFFECFGLGKWGLQLRTLKACVHHLHGLREELDLLCILCEEEVQSFAGSNEVVQEASSLVEKITDIIMLSTRLASVGMDYHAAGFQGESEGLKAAAHRTVTRAGGFKEMAADHFGASGSCFAFCLERLSTRSLEMIEDLRKLGDVERYPMKVAQTLAANFVAHHYQFCRKRKSEGDRSRFVLRNICSIMTTFLWGFVGFSTTIEAYSPDACITVAFLISSYRASTVKLTTQRLEGVLVGTVVGQLVHAFLGFRTPTNVCLTACTLFLWEGICSFFHHTSINSGYAFNLAGAFAARFIISRPSNLILSDAEFSYYYHNILYNTIGVLVMMFIDLLVAHESSAMGLAGQSTMHAFTEIRDGFLVELSAQRCKGAEHKLQSAELLVAEAEGVSAFGFATNTDTFSKKLFEEILAHEKCLLRHLRAIMSLEKTMTESQNGGILEKFQAIQSEQQLQLLLNEVSELLAEACIGGARLKAERREFGIQRLGKFVTEVAFATPGHSGVFPTQNLSLKPSPTMSDRVDAFTDVPFTLTQRIITESSAEAQDSRLCMAAAKIVVGASKRHLLALRTALRRHRIETLEMSMALANS